MFPCFHASFSPPTMNRHNLWSCSSLVVLALMLGGTMLGCTEPEPPVPQGAQNIELLIKPEDRLIHAIEKGDLAAVEQALQTGSDPNSPGTEDLPPLEVAARHGFVDAGRALLAHHAEIDRVPTIKAQGEKGEIVQRRGNSALHTAVATGQVEFVRFLIASKADVNIRNGRDTTPLDIAKNSAEMLKRIEDQTTSPESIASIAEKLATTNTLIAILEENGGQTTQDVEAKKLKEINSGGILGRLPPEIRGSSSNFQDTKKSPPEADVPEATKLEHPEGPGSGAK